LNSGEDRSFAIRSESSSLRLRTTNKRSSFGEVDLARIEDVRRNWPFLRDRRIDTYAPITKPADRLRSLDRKPWPSTGKGPIPDARRVGGRHAATWLAWPHFRGDWPGKLDPFPGCMRRSSATVAPHERVELVVPDAGHRSPKRERFSTKADALSSQPALPSLKTDRIWTRDSGSNLTLQKPGKLRALHFRFNAWAKYRTSPTTRVERALMANAARLNHQSKER